MTCYLLGFGGSLDELAPLEPCKVSTVIKVVSLVIKNAEYNAHLGMLEQ